MTDITRVRAGVRAAVAEEFRREATRYRVLAESTQDQPTRRLLLDMAAAADADADRRTPARQLCSNGLHAVPAGGGACVVCAIPAPRPEGP